MGSTYVPPGSCLSFQEQLVERKTATNPSNSTGTSSSNTHSHGFLLKQNAKLNMLLASKLKFNKNLQLVSVSTAMETTCNFTYTIDTELRQSHFQQEIMSVRSMSPQWLGIADDEHKNKIYGEVVVSWFQDWAVPVWQTTARSFDYRSEWLNYLK